LLLKRDEDFQEEFIETSPISAEDSVPVPHIRNILYSVGTS